MQFMVTFRIRPGNKNKVVEAFEQRGPNRSPGVTFRGAWISTNADLAFVLTEAETESLVTKAGQWWNEFGAYEIHPVIDVERF